MSKKISEIATRAVPPTTKGEAAPTTPTPSTSDGSEALQLDPFVVNEEKEPKFKERELLTPRERLELAHRLNPGLKFGRLPLGNDAVALEMLEAELEKQRREELKELESVLKVGGVKPPPEVQRKIDEALTRDNGWLNQPVGTRYREIR